jgi:pSer/pThr/pTyr-binding forkhead associated (FHA) protein
MELLEIIGGPRRSASWPFLVELEHSRASMSDLVRRPVVPLARRDGCFGDVIVGRSGRAHVKISAASVSQDHAVFRPFPDGSWQVIDRESTNGTWLNGVRLSPGVPTRVTEGSVLRFGRKKFAFGANRLRALLAHMLQRRDR